MSASSVYCYILQGDVTVVSDTDGRVTNVVCPHFWRLTHGCNLKGNSAGFMSYLAGKIADKVAGTRVAHCEFGEPTDNPTARMVRRF